MIVRKQKTYRVNLGNYEHVEISCAFEVNTEEDQMGVNDAMVFIDTKVDAFMKDELAEARITTDASNSFVFPLETYRKRN